MTCLNIDNKEVENELITRRDKINNFKGERKEIKEIQIWE